MKLNLFVTDLHEYNNGNLIGAWFDIADYVDYEDMCKTCGINPDHEIFVTDYETDLALNTSNEYPDFEELKAFFDAVKNEDLEIVNGLLEYCSNRLDQVLDIIEQNRYSPWWLDPALCMSNEEKLGYALVNEGIINIPAEIEPYFDYEKYGRDFNFNTNGLFTNNYYIELY